MRKTISSISLLAAIFLLSVFSESRSIDAIEVLSKTGHVPGSKTFIKKTDSCTERCHVNFMAYENDYKSSKRVEIFRHKTHSIKQDLDCSACHNESEVNTEGHGKLTIEQKNCLKCHHVESEDYECKGCHIDIDENPMEYDKEKFVHGFTVESDVDCGLCHIKDPGASLKDEINCVKCHHTTPDLDCVKCHEDDINRSFNADPQKEKSFSWTISFDHSQHPEQDLSCKECHLISHENDVGIVGYDLNCSKCHHVTEEVMDCIKCHKEPSAYLRGEVEVEGIDPVPDMMSRAVKCEYCHKYDDEGLKFEGVKEYCIECHNGYYGKLYDAWKHTIRDRLNNFNNRLLFLGEEHQSSQLKRRNLNWNIDEGRITQSNMDAFMEKTGKIVDLITKYGIHNFNLTRLLMNYLEEKTKLN